MTSIRRGPTSPPERTAGSSKSHTPLDGLPWRDDTTYVAVGRDPRRLGIVVPEDRWPELVEAATFRSMRSRPMELAPNAGAIWKDDSAFFHCGSSGQRQELVGEHAADRYDQIVRELTDDEEFLSWLHRP